MKKTRIALTVLAILAVAAVFVLASCSSDYKPSPEDNGFSIWMNQDGDNDTREAEPPETEPAQPKDTKPSDNEKPVPDPAPDFGDIYQYYYEQLDDDEKMIYDGLLECAKDGSEVAGFTGIDFNSDDDMYMVVRAAEAFLYDHREFFYYPEQVAYLGAGDYNGYSVLQLNKYEYFENSTSFSRYQNEFEKRVNEIVKETERNCSDDYEKAQYVHDYLVTHAAYDHKACDEIMNNPWSYDPSYDQVFSAYGCIVNGDCVCAGYAAAYKVILDRLGIPCVFVCGWGDPTLKDVGHAWNRIVLDGESYYVDITWDDGAEVYDDRGEQIYPESVLYSYFNITTDDLLQTHLIETDLFEQPECEEDEYNYYNYNGYLIDRYDFDKFIEIAESQEDNPAINIRFSNYSDAAKAEREFESGGYDRIKWLKNKDFGWAFDDSNGCVVIVYK